MTTLLFLNRFLNLPQNCDVKLYIDHTSLSTTANCRNTTASVLSVNLVTMQDWARPFNHNQSKQVLRAIFPGKGVKLHIHPFLQQFHSKLNQKLKSTEVLF